MEFFWPCNYLWIMLMYYIDVMGFLEHPEKDCEAALEEATSSPPDEE